MSAIRRWRSAFRELDRCPWPGPRPLRLGAEGEEWADRIVGRDGDIDRFGNDVLSHGLIVLTGDSGVGKSSLLNVGLVPALSAHDYHPLVCNDWTSEGDVSGDPETFVTAKIAPHLSKAVAAAARSDGLGAALDDRYGGRAVLVLDQFEELIRYQPLQFRAVTDWIAELNQRHSTRVVLSLRAEFNHRLRALAKKARPFSMTTMYLDPMTDKDDIKEVIDAGNRHGPAITPRAAAKLVEAWEQAVNCGSSTAAGLLHLQAALYALHGKAQIGAPDGVRTIVEPRHVKALTDRGAGEDFTRESLRLAVDLKLARCVEACATVGAFNDFLVEGASGAVERAVRHLSSGDYKLDLELGDLVRNSLDRELELLDPAGRWGDPILRVLAGAALRQGGRRDLLTMTTADVAQEVDAANDRPAAGSCVEALKVGAWPWEADPANVSAGPMLGRAPTAVLIEELRRFLLGVEWLRAADLVRTTTPQPGEIRVSLIHDGFAAALRTWAGARSSGPSQALSRLTAATGARFEWLPEKGHGGPRELDGRQPDGKARVVVNVRWRDCQVSTNLRQVVFVGCDFSGSRFQGCRLEGVVFLNCLLDNTTFSGCTIVGQPELPQPEPRQAGEPRPLPSFEVDGDEALVAGLAWYAGHRASGRRLYSPTAGLPVSPVRDRKMVLVDWRPQRGGVTMYGGRLSSLMVRACSFERSGTIALRHVSGSSLDLVEQRGGRLDVADSLVRSLTVTTPQDLDVVAKAGERFRMVCAESVLAELWFGAGLRGQVTIEHSVVVHLWNSHRDLKVQLRDCSRAGVVNVAAVDTQPREGIEERRLTDQELVPLFAARIDYRSLPAKAWVDDSRGQQRPAKGS